MHLSGGEKKKRKTRRRKSVTILEALCQENKRGTYIVFGEPFVKVLFRVSLYAGVSVVLRAYGLVENLHVRNALLAEAHGHVIGLEAQDFHGHEDAPRSCPDLFARQSQVRLLRGAWRRIYRRMESDKPAGGGDNDLDRPLLRRLRQPVDIS